MLRAMGELGDLYAEGRNRIIDLVSDADPSTPVPTCPAWTVKDVLAHVAGIPADILAGRLDGAATDAWTAAQVDARRGNSIEEIVADWQETGPQIDAMFDSFGRTGEQLLTDLTTHEHDMRHALGRPGGRDAAVLDTAVGFLVEMGLDSALSDRGLGPLEVKADHLSWTIGSDGPPTDSLTTTRFELLRAATGRRSAAQVKAMGWSDDPERYLPAFEASIFTLSPTDIVE